MHYIDKGYAHVNASLKDEYHALLKVRKSYKERKKLTTGRKIKTVC